MYRSDWILVFAPLLIVFDFAPEAGGPRMYIANEVADELMQNSKYDSVKAPLQKDFEAIPELTGEQFENQPLSLKDNSGPPHPPICSTGHACTHHVCLLTANVPPSPF